MPFLAAIPATALAGISIASTVAGTAVATVGALQSAQAQSRAANFNVQVQQNNAQMAAWNRQQQEQQAATQQKLTAQSGAVEASRMEQKNRAAEAARINNLLASGVTMSGSAEDVVRSASYNDELDVMDQEYQTQLRVYGEQAQEAGASYNDLIRQNNYLSAASLDRSEARNDEDSGYLNAGGTLLSGAGRAAGQYAQFKDEGYL